MLKWQKIYWLSFNALGRVVGAGFTLFGGVFTLWGVSLVLDRNATIAVNGMPSGDLWIKSIVLIVGVGMGVIGMMILMSLRSHGKGSVRIRRKPPKPECSQIAQFGEGSLSWRVE